jgi:sterol 24-C-methyltransferase
MEVFKMTAPKLTNIRKLAPKDQKVQTTLESYVSHFEATTEGRKSKYKQIANDYYDLATHFYEFGWGPSFHFAPRYKGENLAASLARYEYSLAHRLRLQPGMKVLDIGCGIGGPMRAIARFSGSHILGINNNAYQIQRGQKLNGDAGLSELCDFLKTDFMQMPLPDQSVDAIYTIEAICYAPDKKKLGTELLRVMKDGSYIAGNDWCLTDRYDPNNPEHRSIKEGIEIGCGLGDIGFTTDTIAAFRGAGLEVIESHDLALDSDPETPWYLPLAEIGSWKGLKNTVIGRSFIHRMVRTLETVRVAPKGSTDVHKILRTGADALVLGGKSGIFTPLFFFYARKPTS